MATTTAAAAVLVTIIVVPTAEAFSWGVTPPPPTAVITKSAAVSWLPATAAAETAVPHRVAAATDAIGNKRFSYRRSSPLRPILNAVSSSDAAAAAAAGGDDLRGKVAVVTGSSRGIGKGIAVTLGERGCTVYVTGRSAGGTTTNQASAAWSVHDGRYGDAYMMPPPPPAGSVFNIQSSVFPQQRGGVGGGTANRLQLKSLLPRT